VTYGVVLTLAAIGALCGNVLAERLADRMRPARVLPPAVGGFAAAFVVMGVFPTVVLIAGSLATLGFAGATWNVVTVSLRQRIIPNDLLGRVNSIYRLVAYGTMPLGAIGGGVLARTAGLRAPFLTAGLLTAATIPTLRRRLPQTCRA